MQGRERKELGVGTEEAASPRCSTGDQSSRVAARPQPRSAHRGGRSRPRQRGAPAQRSGLAGGAANRRRRRPAGCTCRQGPAPVAGCPQPGPPALAPPAHSRQIARRVGAQVHQVGSGMCITPRAHLLANLRKRVWQAGAHVLVHILHYRLLGLWVRHKRLQGRHHLLQPRARAVGRVDGWEQASKVIRAPSIPPNLAVVAGRLTEILHLWPQRVETGVVLGGDHGRCTGEARATAGGGARAAARRLALACSRRGRAHDSVTRQELTRSRQPQQGQEKESPHSVGEPCGAQRGAQFDLRSPKRVVDQIWGRKELSVASPRPARRAAHLCDLRSHHWSVGRAASVQQTRSRLPPM